MQLELDIMKLLRFVAVYEIVDRQVENLKKLNINMRRIKAKNSLKLLKE